MDFKEQQKEAVQIRKDIGTAHAMILDALNRYKKQKLGARSKKLANNMELMFADLKDYSSKRDIQDYYGYGNITEKEYDRLCDLWDKREEFVDENGRFSDRVTEMVFAIIPLIGTEYTDFLEAAKEINDENERNIKEVEKTNQKAVYERYISGVA